MKLNKVYKISAIIFMVSFVLMSWQGVDFGMNTGLASSE